MHFSAPFPFCAYEGCQQSPNLIPPLVIYIERKRGIRNNGAHIQSHTHTHLHTYSYTMGVGSTKGCKQCNIKGGLHPREVGIYIYIYILRECDGMRAFLARYYILYHPFYTSPFTPIPFKPPKPLNTHSPPSPAPF